MQFFSTSAKKPSIGTGPVISSAHDSVLARSAQKSRQPSVLHSSAIGGTAASSASPLKDFPASRANKGFLLNVKNMGGGGFKGLHAAASSVVVADDSKRLNLTDFLDGSLKVNAGAGFGGAHHRGGKQVNHRMHASQMTSPERSRGAAIAWADGSVISAMSREDPAAAPVSGQHTRVKSMLTKPENATDAVLDYGGMRDGLMTPDEGAQRRKQSQMTQAKINQLRKKLNSQNASRSRGRRFTSETNADKNIQGGYQNGFVANGGQDALSTNQHQGLSDTMKRRSLSNRNGFMSHKRTADSVDYSSLADHAPLDRSRKLRNSKLVFSQTSKDLTWQDHYQATQRKTATFNDPEFGLKGYALADSKLKDFNYKIQAISYAKEHKTANDHYLDQHQRANKWKPDCKNKHDDWSNPKFTGGGKFLKGPKETYIAAIIKHNKAKPMPAPGHYPMKDLMTCKAALKSGSRGEKFLEFTEQAKWQALQAPGPGNRSDKITFALTEKKPRAASMHAESEK